MKTKLNRGGAEARMENMITKDEDGQTVRGFRVGVKSAGRTLTLPPTGHSLYTGEQALAVLRSYAKNRPGLDTVAFTSDVWAGLEVLTLQELAEIFETEVAG